MAQLGAIRVHEYRGIDQLDLLVKPLTVVIGENNAGKSTLLQALGADPFYPGEEERASDGAATLQHYYRLDSAEFESVVGRTPAVLVRELTAKAVTVDRSLSRLRRAIEEAGLLVAPSESGLTDVYVFRSSALVHEVSACLSGDISMQPAALTALVNADPDCLVQIHATQTPLATAPPTPVTVRADPDDVTALLTSLVIELLHHVWSPLVDSRGEVLDALRSLDEGRLRPAAELGMLTPVIAELERRAVGMAPPFVLRSGPPVIQINEGPDSSVGVLRSGLERLAKLGLPHDANELVASLRAEPILDRETHDLSLDASVRRPDSAAHPFSHLGRGTRRWISACFAEAARRLLDDLDQTDWQFDPTELERALASGEFSELPETPPRPLLFLVDEPGESLHPLAQHEILDWLEQRVAAGDQVVLTSHHGRMLETVTDSQDVSMIGLRRRGHSIAAASLSGIELDVLEHQVGDFGMTKRDVLLVARGLLIVEGKDDLRVIKHLFGRALASRGIFVMQIGGSSSEKVLSLLDSAPVRLLQLSSWVLFDKTSSRFATQSGSPESEEERALLAILDGCKSRGLDLTVLPFPAPDVLCGFNAKHFSSIMSADPNTRPYRFDGWATVVQDWGHASKRAQANGRPRPSFKDWLLGSRFRLQTNGSRVAYTIDRLIDQTPSNTPAMSSTWMSGAITDITKQIDGARQ